MNRDTFSRLNRVKGILFDLDNTLYPPACGLFDAIDGRINLYLQEFYGVGPDLAGKVRRDYARRYGLTLTGLMKERNADPGHYLDYVHEVPVSEYLSPNLRLRGALESISASRVIFTNGSRRHSLAVTRALGVSEAFEEIFDIASVRYVPKPDPRSYAMVLDRLGGEGAEAVLVEDLPRNLPPARDLGMTTILVGGRAAGGTADYELDSIEELPDILPDLT